MTLFRSLARQFNLLLVRITLLFSVLLLVSSLYLFNRLDSTLDGVADQEQARVNSILEEIEREIVAQFSIENQTETQLLVQYERHLFEKVENDFEVALYNLEGDQLGSTSALFKPAFDCSENLVQESPTNSDYLFFCNPILVDAAQIGWQVGLLDMATPKTVEAIFRADIYAYLSAMTALILATGVYLRSFTRRNLSELQQMIVDIGKGRRDGEPGGELNGEFREIGDAVLVMREQLVQLEEDKKIVFDRIMHDVNSPLAAIQAFSSLYQSEDVNPEQQREWDIVGDCVVQVDRLMSDLRQIMNDQLYTDMDLNKQPDLDILAAIHRIARTYDRDGISITLPSKKSLPKGPLYTPMEPGTFRRILGNLMDNALDHGEADHIMISLEEPTTGNVHISVRDNGKGIPDTIIDKIFEPQFSSAKPGSGSHSGWGLANVRDIVQGHQGEISVESTVGLQTSFTISLTTTEVEKSLERNN